MKRLLWLIALSGLIIAGLTLNGCSSKKSSVTGSGPSVTGGTAQYVAKQLLIKVKPGADLTGLLRGIGGEVVSYSQNLDYYRIQYSANLDVESAQAKMSNNKQVLLAEPNYIMKAFVSPSDPDYPKQWGYQNTKAENGWNFTTGSDSFTIAIVDTGIDSSHQEFTGKLVTGYNAISTYSSTSDDNGHGTHCAGIAAAISDNGIGITGVAPGCKLMPVKALNYNGEGSVSDIAEGIDWAARNGADIISLSLGGPGYSRVLNDAVDYAIQNKVIVVAATGNDSKYNDNQFPAAFPGVIAVGATRPNNTKAAFSTETSHLFISAPGDNIFSTLDDSSYGYMSGTSMATPFIAGAIALIKSRYESGDPLDVNQICSQLKATAFDLESANWDQRTGWGLVNLEAALIETQLKPVEFGGLTVSVVDNLGNVYPNKKVLLKNKNGIPIYNVLTDSNGKANFWTLPQANYTIDIDDTTRSATVTPGNTTVAEFTYTITSIFTDNADTEPAGMTTEGTWAKTSADCHSAPNC